MKTAYALLFLVASITFAKASVGPPPFTNGSPLISGTNGTYQASVRGNNLTGVVSFSYTSGAQNTGTWVIFYQGQVFSGGADVVIADGSMTGVLETSSNIPVTTTNSDSDTNNSNATVTDSGDTNSATSSDTVSASTVTTALTGASGYFNASLDNNSPTGAFKGKGEFSYVAQVTDSNSDSSSSSFDTPDASGDASSSSSSTSSSTQIIKENFKIKGVRVAVTS